VVQKTVSFGTGSSVVLTSTVGSLPIPIWFIIFSLYTVPFSLVFRRVLKDYWLRRYATEHHIAPFAPGPPPAGGLV